jgi:hypothetical protein
MVKRSRGFMERVRMVLMTYGRYGGINNNGKND